MKILVTGANGYLGRGIVKCLLDEGCDVVGEQRFLNGTVYGVRPAMWIDLNTFNSLE